MKLLNEYEMSWWALLQCLNGNDTPEIRDLITDSKCVFIYSKIKDIPEARKYIEKKIDEYEISSCGFWLCKKGNNNAKVRSLITHSYFAYLYCLQIKDIKEMWSLINHTDYARCYCRWVKDRPELWSLILTKSRNIYLYCKDVKDREEMWKKITNPIHAKQYCKHVKDRPEVRKYIK